MKKTSTGLEENIAGLLCYVLGWVSGLVFVLIEKENKFVRFHAFQSIIVFGAITVLSIIFGALSSVFILFLVIYYLIGLASLVLWILLMVKAFQGQVYKLPWAGDQAEAWAGGGTIQGSSPSNASDQELKNLTELRNSGVLTEEEYQQKRAHVEKKADSADKLKSLTELRDAGVLSEEEYEQKKKQITG